MKKTIFLLFVLAALAVDAQNNNEANPPVNTDVQFQVALNNNPPYRNNISDNDYPQQVQVQAQAPQQVNVNRINFQGPVQTNPVNSVKQQKVGQSIKISAGGGSGYSGSTVNRSRSRHQHKSLDLILKKAFRDQYKHSKHYSHKKRVKKCHTF